MINIFIPDNNLEERKYLLNIFFNQFLELDYQVYIDSNIKNWKIVLPNKNQLIIEDHFFNKFPNRLEYLKFENMPSNIEFVKNQFILENDIPILYGNQKLEVSTNNITCGTDIFASSFFMLTRWEEYVNKKRDKLDRFSAYESIAYKNNFLQRPVVNEYIEMLWNMLINLGYEKKRKENKFDVLLTHDIDFLLMSKTPLKVFIKTLAGDIIKRKNLVLAFSFAKDYLLSFYSKRNDPYDTFNYLMEVSEKNKLKSYFFFMAKGETIYDNNYSTKDTFFKRVVSKIKSRDHHIGIHGTFNSYDNYKQFRKEKKELENEIETKIEFGRQHYLRFKVPETWQLWEDNNMKWDSTVYYPEMFGFRVGTCYEYPVFNILTQKSLGLKEKPLIIMDGFVSYQSDKSKERILSEITEIIHKVAKYEGTLVLLWHNCSFNNREWNKYNLIYEDILNVIKGRR